MSLHPSDHPVPMTPASPAQADLIESLGLVSGQPTASPAPAGPTASPLADDPAHCGVAGVLKIDEQALDRRLGHMVRDTVEKTLNDFLEAEAQDLCGAEKHERSTARKGYRSGSYDRTFLTKAGEVTLKMPKVRGVGNKYEPLKFESQIIARYRRREISIEEALVSMATWKGSKIGHQGNGPPLAAG